jgi:glycerol uptake facilitator-like aquaporin
MPASFGAAFASEALAMCVVIIIGNGVIANEVLLRTKGHGLGLGHVSVGYGMAFFTAIAMFGHISAAVDPALLLAEARLLTSSYVPLTSKSHRYYPYYVSVALIGCTSSVPGGILCGAEIFSVLADRLA